MPTIPELASYTAGLTKLRTNFKTADKDGNGGISATEFEAVPKASAGLSGKDGLATAQIFKKLDSDGNGAITQAELTSGINLATQVQSVLLQGQEIAQGGAFLSLLNNTGGKSTGSLYDSLFASTPNGSFANLTSNLLGGSSSTSLTSILTGANANTSVLASLTGGNNNALLESLIAKYTDLIKPSA